MPRRGSTCTRATTAVATALPTGKQPGHRHEQAFASTRCCRISKPNRSQRQLPDFGPGDTVVVNVKVKEGNRERVQAYEGVVIAKKNAGLNSAFTVRKISHGFGVERVFQTHSADHRLGGGQAPRQGPRRQAVLPARPGRQEGAHQGRPRRQRQGQGRCERRRRVIFAPNRYAERPPSGGRFVSGLPGASRMETWRTRSTAPMASPLISGSDSAPIRPCGVAGGRRNIALAAAWSRVRSCCP